MKISSKQVKPGIVVVGADGRIDVSNAQQLEEELNKIIKQGNYKLVINFQDIKYTSSAGLRVFISIAKLVKAKKEDLKLCALSPNIFKIFKLAGFTKIFSIYDTEDDAIKSFR